jgi:aspartate-semialdehyde dehydrogenase
VKNGLKGKKKFRVAVLGATGAVGQEMLRILEERSFPVESIAFLASERSAGKLIAFRGRSYEVAPAGPKSFDGVDIVLASAGGAVSRALAPAAVRAGAVVIDNTSAFRMDPKVPLVIPEINGREIRKHRGIIANPNCSTIIMLMPLYPLDRADPIRRVVAATYQAASGAGSRAMEELKVQAGDVLAERPVEKRVFPHQIAFNVFSHNSRVGPEGYNEEEIKMVRETHKILGRRSIRVSVTCVRVPVLRAHSEALFVDFARPMTPARARAILKKAPGIRLVDEPEKNYFPMPLDAAGRDEVLVGRIRQDLFSPKSLGLFVSGDQLRKGAALNAVQIAEELCGL